MLLIEEKIAKNIKNKVIMMKTMQVTKMLIIQVLKAAKNKVNTTATQMILIKEMMVKISMIIQMKKNTTPNNKT